MRHNTAAVPSVAKREIVALYEATRGIAAAAISAPDRRVLAQVSDGACAETHHESAMTSCAGATRPPAQPAGGNGASMTLPIAAWSINTDVEEGSVLEREAISPDRA